MSSWRAHEIHFIDFEGNLRSGVLEYGVATVRDGAVVRTSTRLCRPRARVLPDESAVHGLTDADLRDAAPLSDDWTFFSALRESGPLAAHCAGVENSLLRSVWPYPRSSPDFARPGSHVAEWGPWVDSASLCREFLPSLASVRLSELVQVLGLQVELDRQAALWCPPSRACYHAALYDALAGALVLCHLAGLEQVRSLSLPRLIALSAQDASRRDDLQQGSLF